MCLGDERGRLDAGGAAAAVGQGGLRRREAHAAALRLPGGPDAAERPGRLAVAQGRQEVRRQRQRVGVLGAGQVRPHERHRLLHGRAALAAARQRQRHVGGGAHAVAGHGVHRAVEQVLLVGVEGAVGALLRDEPLARARDDAGIDEADARDVVELVQPVGGEHLVRRRAAEPGEAAAGDLEREQPLVAEGQVLLGPLERLGLAGAGAAQVLEDERVRVGRGRGLLEAPRGHADHAVQAVERLAHRAGEDADRQPRRLVDGVRRHRDLVAHAPLQPVADGGLDGHAVGGDVRRALDGVGERAAARVHGEAVGAEARGADAEVAHADLPRGEVDRLLVLGEALEPGRGLEAQLHVAGLLLVVVDGHRHRDLVAHGEAVGQVDVDEEVLEDAHAQLGGADAAVLGRGHR